MNMNMKQLIAAALASVLAATSFAVEMPTEPRGGHPPQDVKQLTAQELESQVTYQRAFEAVIWSVPAVSISQLYRAAIENGAEPNTIMAFSKPATQKSEFLTANNVTPYILSQTDLRKGPVVIDVPKQTDKAGLFGQIVDHWQITVADIGPVGVDKGKGAKILLTPPGYDKPIPKGYIEVKCPSYRIVLVFRSIPSPKASVEDAYAFSKTVKMYYLDDPKPTKFIDPSGMQYSTLSRYDERWFDDLNEIIQVENAYPRDKVMTGMLATIGIEKGKHYNPDEKTKKIFRQAAADAYYYMQNKFLHDYDEESLWWGKDTQWRDYLYTDPNQGFEWETDDMIEIDNRALNPWFTGIVIPKKMAKRPATMYLLTTADENGNIFEAGKTYSLTIPKNVPAERFWSLTVYSSDTFAFIYTKEGRVGISSRELDKLKLNDDGSVTLYFGQKAPKGLESNWIPTSDKAGWLVFRLYGPTDALFDRSFKLPDAKLVTD